MEEGAKRRKGGEGGGGGGGRKGKEGARGSNGCNATGMGMVAPVTELPPSSPLLRALQVPRPPQLRALAAWLCLCLCHLLSLTATARLLLLSRQQPHITSTAVNHVCRPQFAKQSPSSHTASCTVLQLPATHPPAPPPQPLHLPQTLPSVHTRRKGRKEERGIR